MSYRGQKKGNYGDSSKRGRFPWVGSKKKPKPKENRENIVYVKEDPEPKVPPETIVWTPRPLPLGTKVILNRPTSLNDKASNCYLQTI